MTKKQGIEKVLEEFDKSFGTAGIRQIMVFSPHNDTYVKMFPVDAFKSFLRSAIETAFKEVSTADFSRQTARIFKNEAHQRGYIAALSDYDQAVDKFLGK